MIRVSTGVMEIGRKSECCDGADITTKHCMGSRYRTFKIRKQNLTLDGPDGVVKGT